VNKIVKVLLLITCSLQFHQSADAQLKTSISGPVDTNYIESYINDLTTRIYQSVKYTRYRIYDGDYRKSLVFDPNRRLIFGIGFTHGPLTLNLGVPAPWIPSEKREETYGETNYLDLQSHIYLRKFTVDFYLQTVKGYYISNPSEMLEGWQEGDDYTIRPDMRLRSFALSIQYFKNGDRYSYKAVFNQNEWQKKSAGSLILAGGFNYVVTNSDSLLIPENIAYSDFFRGENFSNSKIFSAGPSIGYAHTFVIAKHFFIAASWHGGVTAGFTKLRVEDPDNINKTGFSWHFHSNLRLGTGYNSRKWFVGFTYLNHAVRNQAPVDAGWIHFDTGNLRLNIVRRFQLKKPIKILNPQLW
jgi:hypothetical protein